MVINLKNQAGMVTQAKLGFSWTTFFFGFIVAIVRNDWKWCLIQLLAATFTFGFSALVFPFVYNKIYVKGLLEKGYVAADENSRMVLVSKGIISAHHNAA